METVAEVNHGTNANAPSASRLFNVAADQWTSDQHKQIVDIYKTLVDMADKISQRRQASHGFFLTINTALLGAVAYVSTLHPTWLSTGLISVFGVFICLIWYRTIVSYKLLNKSKFAIINEIERTLVIRPFTHEWQILNTDDADQKHRQFHDLEKWVPRIFLTLHILQLLRVVFPWNALWTAAKLACP